MKKQKKSPRSRITEHRPHKTSRSHRRRQLEVREKHGKHHRSRSPSSSKQKTDEEKERENPKQHTEVRTSVVKMDVVHCGEDEQDCTDFENFINDSDKMIQVLFDAISEDSLKKITPDSLKNCPLEELKIMCLEELKRMSSAEIIHILSGKDPSLFETSKKANNAKDDPLVKDAEDKEEHPNPGVKAKVADDSHSSSSERLKKLTTSNRLTAEDEQESMSSVVGDTKSEAESDSLELCATQKEIDSLIQEEILNQTGAQGLAQQSKSDLTDMEILELELRARIIRSLLKRHGMEISDEDERLQQKENVVIKEENT